jgi:DNA helicase-2/ATP-dependent DNA helicase PcrA
MVIAQERLELASLVQEYQALKLRLGPGGVRRPDGHRRPARGAGPGGVAAPRSSFAVVLLDEYQDTSAAQATMLPRPLLGGDAE